jgi:dolichol-phosphate mannosyltransferase
MVGGPIEVSIVIPAYREADNLSVLVPRLAAVLSRAGLKGEVIVVDDDSRDGTDALCARLSQSFPVRLLSRFDERGLASAVVLGIHHARGEVLVVMDADLSHPPEAVPELVAACRSPFVDFVIGSRYIEGSSVDPSWSRLRRLNSRVASLLARGLTVASDPLAGFFAIKRSTFQTAAELKALGYKIGLELIVRCNCRRIVEVPITFEDRIHGTSKLTILQQWQYLRHLARLYIAKFPSTSRFVRIGLVRLTSTMVDLCSFSYLLLWTPLWFARVAAIACAMMWSFWWNRRYAFRSAAAARAVRQSITFGTADLLGAMINLSLSLGLCAAYSIFRTNPSFAAATGVVAGATANSLLLRRRVLIEGIVPAAIADTQSSAASATLRQAA